MNRILLRIGVLVLAGSTACVPPGIIGAAPLGSAQPGATTFHTLESGGRTRSYLLHLPPAAAATAVPLVLLLHGDGANGNDIMAASRMNRLADSLGFAVAYPNGTGTLRFAFLHWNAATCCGYGVDHAVDDVGFADSLIATLVRTGRVDSTRVYAAGFSAGGMLALRIACQSAGRVRAVADVEGVMPDTTCQPSRPVSVLLFQGTSDNALRTEFRSLLHRGRPFATSLEAALRFWARRDGCTTATVRDSLPNYTVVRPRACDAPWTVALYTIERHPHAWPGGLRHWWFEPKPSDEVNASAVILQFFANPKTAGEPIAAH